MIKEDEFYLRDTRSDVGSSCTFWAKDGCGYTSDLGKAEIFNHDNAQEHANRKNHFIPLSKLKVDKLTTVRVDMQYLKLNVDFTDGIIIQRYLGQYDGNDIYFDCGDGPYTNNYNEAKVYSFKNIESLKNQAGSLLSKRFLDKICRRTIQTKNINMRKMVTNSGIKYISPRKKRPTTGKTRSNCPDCGKITWGYNPYESHYCKDHSGY